MSNEQLCGGWSKVQPISLEVTDICLEVRKAIQEKVKNCPVDVYIPVSFASQIVAGTNYVVKVFVGDVGKDVCVHAMIYQALSCNGGNSTVGKIQFPKTFEDPLVPF